MKNYPNWGRAGFTQISKDNPIIALLYVLLVQPFLDAKMVLNKKMYIYTSFPNSGGLRVLICSIGPNISPTQLIIYLLLVPPSPFGSSGLGMSDPPPHPCISLQHKGFPLCGSLPSLVVGRLRAPYLIQNSNHNDSKWDYSFVNLLIRFLFVSSTPVDRVQRTLNI